MLGDRDFRVKPDTGELEPATERTQQGRVRDDRGNWFGCDNSNILRHYVLDDHNLKRNPFVAYPDAAVNVAPSKQLLPTEVEPAAVRPPGPPNTVTAACGLGIYRDDLLGKEFSGNAFTCEPVNLLATPRSKAEQLDPQGRARRGRTEQRVPRLDGQLVPPGARTHRPGRRVVGRGHVPLPDRAPAGSRPPTSAKIDVRAGSGLGRIYRVRSEKTPPRKRERLDKLDTAGLIAALDSPNGWQARHRDDDARLEERPEGDGASGEVGPRVEERGLARVQALCTLDALGAVSGLKPEDLLIGALKRFRSRGATARRAV